MSTEPRHVYLDTEFLTSDPTTAGFVSIALTDGAGRDYMAVNAQMDTYRVYSHPWMRDHVWPYLPTVPDMPYRLDFTHPAVKTLDEIADEVAAYLDTEQETHLYAYYGAQDAFRLHSLWNHDWEKMPRQVPRWFFDLKALRVQAGNPEMPQQKTGAHDPLEDARYNRTMHEHLLALPNARMLDEGDYTEHRDYEVVGSWGVDGARDEDDARHQVSRALTAYPTCGAHARWRIVRTWEDDAQFCGPWHDITAGE